jgi:hypothetical protein
LYIACWNKKELPREWKELIIVLIHKKEDKTDFNNYKGISLLPNTYKIFRKLEGVVGTGWIWLRIGTVGGRLWVR